MACTVVTVHRLMWLTSHLLELRFTKFFQLSTVFYCFFFAHWKRVLVYGGQESYPLSCSAVVPQQKRVWSSACFVIGHRTRPLFCDFDSCTVDEWLLIVFLWPEPPGVLFIYQDTASYITKLWCGVLFPSIHSTPFFKSCAFEKHSNSFCNAQTVKSHQFISC